MEPRSDLPLAERIAAAQAWWREAGVDLDYADEPQTWLADPDDDAEPVPAEATTAAPEPVSPPDIGGDRALWPQDLGAFRRWWLEEPSLDAGGTFPRVPPRGEAGARVMMLVPMPESGDTEALLSGPEGRLLASLAQAMGFEPDAVYWAAALPRHTPHPDWSHLSAAGLGEAVLHHIRLARPERLLVFGRDVLSLLGHAPPQAPPAVSELSIQGDKLPLLVSYQPERLLQRAAWRASLWRAWLDWTEGTAA